MWILTQRSQGTQTRNEARGKGGCCACSEMQKGQPPDRKGTQPRVAATAEKEDGHGMACPYKNE